MRGTETEEERPERERLGIEIMQWLAKRETSLADALDTLTAVMLNALAAKYGDRDEFFLFNEQASTFLKSTERDRAVVAVIPYPGSLAAKVPPKIVTMVGERSERLLHLAGEIGELLNKRRPSLGDGLNALTSAMVTSIEAACGRKRSDEFDLVLAELFEEVKRFPEGGRVQ
jgi:hypothetical protein